MYKSPSLAVDAIVRLNKSILMIRRLREPFKDCWAFPGGFVDYGEDPAAAVLRELLEETSLVGDTPKLIGVYGAPERDPRKHVVSITYSVTVNDFTKLKAADDAKEARFFEVGYLLQNQSVLAFDHAQILNDYLKVENL